MQHILEVLIDNLILNLLPVSPQVKIAQLKPGERGGYSPWLIILSPNISQMVSIERCDV
jgi:hypothetical protein